MKLSRSPFIYILPLLVLGITALDAQYGSRLGTVQRGGKVSFEPRGPGVLFGALDPSIKKWYIPQELFTEYQWKQSESSNYARPPYYQRYVDTALEGDYFYDFYGDFVSRGWLIYDWRQDQPQELGSSIFKGSQFGSWFSSLVIGGDNKGQYFYSVTVGNRIRTTLTPMTFSKPTFNGVQIDFAADKYSATVIASRISDPAQGVTVRPIEQTNSTSLFGGRAVMQVGEFVELGATLVDARNANTSLDLFSGNLLAGNLTAGQSNTPIDVIAIVLSDDSPEDGEGGAALFGHDIRITSRNFDTGEERVFTLEEVVRQGAEWPIVFGGFPREGFLAADGAERIVLNYDFTDPGYVGPDLTTIVDVEFDYLLANDYKIDLWSNRQTGFRAVPSPPLTGAVIDAVEPALLTLRRASGNVQDISNVQRVKFDYGLPTANMVGGFTIKGTDLWGFDFYGEWDRNVRYSQYPNAALFNANEGHKISKERGDAQFLNISKDVYPFFAFGEAYSIDDSYSTRAFVANADGDVSYDQLNLSTYEFVDDNDDQDQFPDWARLGSSAGDFNVFPGWDENNDFISDFNQNDNGAVPNTIPDYDEPFLRHDVDRPEFLFGIDLNNNNWIDRFEDDEAADYLYKVDRKGYNAFVGVNIIPEARLTLGRTDERMFSDERENVTNYALFTFDKDYPGLGRLRVFDMLRHAEDTIPDERQEPSFFQGALQRPTVEDFLPAQDTWINTAWLGLDFTGIDRLKIINKLKYEFYNQGRDPRDIEGRPLNGTTNFFGLINKVEYFLPLGRLTLHPKIKSELLSQDAFIKEDDDRRHWNGIVQLMAQIPVLQRSIFTTGIELMQFNDREIDEDELLELGQATETGDLRSAIIAVQLANESNYQGFVLTTQIGLRIGRVFTEQVGVRDEQFEKFSQGETETTSFITIYAGVE